MKIYDYTLQELQEVFMKNDIKPLNAKKVFSWVYNQKKSNFEELPNVSNKTVEFLKQNIDFDEMKVKTHLKSIDGTEKFLFELDGNNVVETVLMRHSYGNSICITTQLGCNIGCAFCASGLLKKKRDLTLAEMIQQVLTVEKITKESVTHIVIMGTGEPFDNYENVMSFIDVMTEHHGLAIGVSKITVSTSGIVPKIKQFALEKKQVNLAISLHASNDRIRSNIMKINDVYPLSDLMRALKYYNQHTNKRVTLEYILLEGVNDQIEHADELSDLVKNIDCYVNIIRYNKVEEFDYNGSSEQVAQLFKKRLHDNNIDATLRKEKGADIDAACGQLRYKQKEIK